ncbi:MAG: hypothetical protein AAF988_08665 [Pseudomonadota bacterium]
MNNIIVLLHVVAWLLRTASYFTRTWPIWVILLFFTAENSPHIRMVGGYYGWKYTAECIYLGARGLIPAHHRPYNCPFLLMMNIKTGDVADE